MASTLSFREALNQGIVSGTLVDTKIVLFSRRDSSCRVCGPKALYASSHVLKSVPYFNDLLFGNFSEAEPRDLNEDIGDDELIAEDYGYCSDSDLEDDEDGASSPITLPHNKPGPSDESRKELSDKGRIVRISDIAFITFQAFVFYLYTGKIEFASLGSQGNRGSGKGEPRTTPSDKIPRTSPKSVYRLADKYDIPVLKDLALNCIRNELKDCDIVEETFGGFASRYYDIKMACVSQLVSALRNDTPEKETWTKFCEIIDDRFKEDLGDVKDTLSLLWGATNQGKDASTTTKYNGPPLPTPTHSHPGSDALHAAMVKSIREGVFFDREYRTGYTRGSGLRKALYLSSMIAGTRLEPCIKCVSGIGTPTGDSIGELETDSDCESDSIDTEATTQEEDSVVNAVLSPGSYSAWRSLFFYTCTGQTSFAPLRSQGVDFRLRYILEETTACLPPPCSPKSMYILAKLLNMQPLRDLALKDIKRKLSEDNIVEELFSCVTAREQQVIEMECQLLFSEFKNEDTMTRVQEKLSDMPGNHLAHCAGAFKLGLQAALGLDPRKPDPKPTQTEGVMLRCRSRYCPGHCENFPFSSVGSGKARGCPRCNSWFLECTGCGQVRNGNLARCSSCRKRFL